jgi:siroheme synthase-like protein
VVIGGGAVAERKVAALLDAGAVVTVVSPALSPGLAALVAAGRVAHVARGYASGDLIGAALAFAATDHGEINADVAHEGRLRGVWVNAADDPAYCDAILPALVRRGGVTVAVSTGGASPALARAVRERLESALPQAYAPLADIAADVRRELRAAGRRASADDWRAALDAGLTALLDGASSGDAARVLRARLERARCA